MTHSPTPRVVCRHSVVWKKMSHMFKQVAVFGAASVAVIAVVTAYGTFVADPSGTHGFESGMSAFILGMSHYLVVVVGHVLGFWLAMTTGVWINARYRNCRGTLLSAIVGILSPLTILTCPPFMYQLL
jgi:hypothetical protein